VCDRLPVHQVNPSASRGPSATPRRPIVVDLFSGAGGLGLGFEQAGFDVVAAVEYDPVHAATHAFNFPHCEVLCRDASLLSASDVLAAARNGFRRSNPGRQWPGRVDVIIGGPPCQGFSAGGKREADDDRNNLIAEFVRLVVEVRPEAFCLENVAGLLETKFAAVRESAFQTLREAGYHLSGTTEVLNSIDYGVPQVRRRVVVIGSLSGEVPRPKKLTTPHVKVADAFEGLPSPGTYEGLLADDAVSLTDADVQLRESVSSSYARRLSGLDRDASDLSRPRVWDPTRLTNSRRTTHTPETVARFSVTPLGAVEPKSRLFRLPLLGPSRTLRAGTGSERGSHTSPRPIHPTEDRVITVREAARLHGYPDWFRFHTTNWHGHRQVGNSVPPPLAKAAGIAVRATLDTRSSTLRLPAHLGAESLLRLNRSTAMAVLSATSSEMPANRTRRRTASEAVFEAH
jgi:DNA (cytosine-5)-methyltransferase 1